MLGSVGLSNVLCQIEQPLHPSLTELLQPAKDGGIRKIQIPSTFSGGHFFSQAGGNGVITLLDRTSDGNFIETKRELDRHQAASLVYFLT
jgi:hypothetical protein